MSVLVIIVNSFMLAAIAGTVPQSFYVQATQNSPKKEINTPVNTKEGKLCQSKTKPLFRIIPYFMAHARFSSWSFLPAHIFLHLSILHLQSAIKDPQTVDELLGKEIEKAM